MTEIFRTRDCVVFFKGDAFTVSLSPALRTNGWAGGQGVMWDDSPLDEFRVTYSNGFYGGFLLWGSDESSDQYVSFLRNQSEVGAGVICMGGWLISTLTYEHYTYASRIGGGPLVPIVYQEGLRLRFSLRGLFTLEDEWNIVNPLVTNPFFVGYVMQAPKASNSQYLGIQTAI